MPGRSVGRIFFKAGAGIDLRISWVYVLLSLLVGSVQGLSAAPAADASGPDLSAVALKYLGVERERQVEGATQGAVDAALAYLTETVIYEHARVGARIEGKAALRKGMMGFIGAVRNPRDEIVSKVSGPGVVVLDLQQSFEARRDGRWEPQARHVVKVLEFEGDKIRRIIDYW